MINFGVWAGTQVGKQALAHNSVFSVVLNCSHFPEQRRWDAPGGKPDGAVCFPCPSVSELLE